MSDETKPSDDAAAKELERHSATSGGATLPTRRSQKSGAPSSAKAKLATHDAVKRHPVRAGLGVAGGLGVVILAAAAVVAASVVPSAQSSSALSPAQVQLPPGQSVRVCAPVPALLQGSNVNTDPQFAPGSSSANTSVNAAVGSSQTGATSASSLRSLASDGIGQQIASISSSKDAPSQSNVAQAPSQMTFSLLKNQKVDGVSVLRADPVSQQRPVNGAILTYTANDGDLRGIATASCQSPSNESWLVGASTKVGRTAVLHLSNPSATPATVSLDLFGDQGRIQSAGGNDILVAPGTDKSIVLAGLASDQANLSVRVSSSGAAVSATIVQSVLRGLTSGGVDFIAPSAVPSNEQVISGVVAMAPNVVSEVTSASGYSDAQASLKVTVPSANDSIVQVKMFGANGQVGLPNGGVFTAKGNSTSELTLSGVPAGVYSVQVSADTSIVAAARSVAASKKGEPTDLAMAPSATSLSDNQFVALSSESSARLAVTAPTTDSQISVTAVGADGKTAPARTFTIKGGTSMTIDRGQLGGDSSQGLIISATGGSAYAAQVVTGLGGTGLSVSTIQPGMASVPSVAVGLNP